MKTFFSLILLFVGLLSFAQRNVEAKTIPANKPIEIQNGKFYIEGDYYSHYDIKNHLMVTNSDAYKAYKSYKTKSSVGGFLLGAGGALIVCDVIRGLASDVDYPSSFTYVGAGLVAVSIPVLSGRKKRLQQSIDTYNETITPNKTMGLNVDVLLVSNRNGIGLTVTF
ncbi:hypothetical protein [Flavobacterium sp.]|uniref:hypothetical protein n=1 Tax=Flavobacterium sp. TaxID=239 RepID=UPI0035289BE5